MNEVLDVTIKVLRIVIGVGLAVCTTTVATAIVGSTVREMVRLKRRDEAERETREMGTGGLHPTDETGGDGEVDV